MNAILMAAISMLGLSPVSLGLPEQFWCQDFVSAAVAKAGHTGGGNSPGEVMLSLVPSGPEPGAVVAVDLFPGNDTAEHVAIVELVLPDGSIHTIEGNGPDPNKVVRAVRRPEEVLGFGVTPETKETYQDQLCQQLQEDKPWIDWECELY